MEENYEKISPTSRLTTVYLRRLEGEQDCSWDKVAQAIGV